VYIPGQSKQRRTSYLVVCFLLDSSPASEFYILYIFTGRYLPMKMEQSVPKRRHIKFRSRGIAQKKAYNIQNTTKV
jgi:hypothetical protein